MHTVQAGLVVYLPEAGRQLDVHGTVVVPDHRRLCPQSCRKKADDVSHIAAYSRLEIAAERIEHPAMEPRVDVLLIEDDEFDSRAVLRALKQHPQVGDVAIRRSGEEAMDWLRQGTPEKPSVGIVVLDLGLPGMTGLELLKALKNDLALAHLPVIVLSDSSDPNELLEVYRLGACAFLRKPESADGYRKVLDGVTRFWLIASWPPQPT